MTDFEVFGEMIKEGKDIAASPHFVSANLAKGGGHVTMGVDAATVHKLAFGGEYRFILYVVKKSDFDEVKRGIGS